MNKEKVKPFEEVTLWSRFNHKKKEFEHNHIEGGWSGLEAPLPKSQSQAKDWKGATWKKHYGFLKEGRVIEIGEEGVIKALDEMRKK